MAVVAHDISGSGNDGTIDELVIVRVGGDEVETVGRIDALQIWSLHQLLQHGVGDDKIIAFGQYLVVLIEYLSLVTQSVYLLARKACQMSLLYDPGMMTLTRQLVSSTIFISMAFFRVGRPIRPTYAG